MPSVLKRSLDAAGNLWSGQYELVKSTHAFILILVSVLYSINWRTIDILMSFMQLCQIMVSQCEKHQPNFRGAANNTSAVWYFLPTIPDLIKRFTMRFGSLIDYSRYIIAIRFIASSYQWCVLLSFFLEEISSGQSPGRSRSRWTGMCHSA